MGDIFTLVIKAQVGTWGTDGIGAFLNFDPQYLEVVGPTGVPTTTIGPGSDLPLVLLYQVDNTAGYIDFDGMLGGTPATGNLNLATVRFRLKKVTTGTQISFDNHDLMQSLTDSFLEEYSILDLTTLLGSYLVYLTITLHAAFTEFSCILLEMRERSLG